MSNINNNKNSSRPRFATKIGAVATTAGAAVGLGNVWRFPYEAGVHGGGAFMLFYIIFILFLGIPVICSEFIMGRAARANELGAFRKFTKVKAWSIVPIIGIIASIMILSFYSVVAGWTMEYFVESATGGLDLGTQQQYHDAFGSFITGNWRPLFWTLAFLALNAFVLLRGVSGGIEKISNILMPVLFILLIIFCINSLTMPKAKEGLEFLFKPDFSAITPSVLIGALGQAFFSLSIGLGCMMTYASYFTSDSRIGRTAVTTAVLDTFVAILSGVIIFPAVFSFDVSPEAGPTLVFEVLPAIFHQLPGGVIWSSLFFFLLMVASITSTISMSEISISYFIEEFKMNRRFATWLSTGIAVVFGSLCCLSFGCLSNVTLFGQTIFDLFNNVSSNVLLPIGGMLTSIFVGWVLPGKVIKEQLTNGGSFKFRAMGIIVFCLRWIAPVAIFVILLNAIGVI